MKKVLLAVLMVSSVNAFAGYTAEVCQTTESGQKIACREVYFERDLGQPASYQEPVRCDGEGQNTICEKPAAHVPTLLKKINKFFQDRGFQAPNNDEDTIKAGG